MAANLPLNEIPQPMNGPFYNSLAVRETRPRHALRSILFGVGVLSVLVRMAGILAILGLSVVSRL
jgi:hypothetical protein